MIRQIEPWIDEAEARQLARVIASTYVTEGPLTEEFEARIRDLTGSPHAIAYTNGTLAQFALMKACGIGPGDEVIVPDMTFIATCNAVILAGAKPVLADVDRYTLGLSAATVEPLITSRTKAIVPVHLYGGMVDIEELLELGERRNILVLEDAAQGVGVTLRGRHAGTWGRAGFLSFYGNKTMTTAEGGVILTRDDELAKACFRLKNHGRSKKGVFIHETIGFNFSFTDLQAAVGLAQLEKLPEIIRRKQRIHDAYRAAIGGRQNLTFGAHREGIAPVHWFTNVFADDAEALADYMTAREIGTRRFFYPLHRQPCYTDQVGRADAYPVTEMLFRTGLSMPSSATLTEPEIATVAAALSEFVEMDA